MGFLIQATPLSWDEAQAHIRYVKQHGIKQFINVFNSVKNIRGDTLKFGDELEYHILKVDKDARTVKVSLRGAEVLEALKQMSPSEHPNASERYEKNSWVPEYGSWMVEGVPGRPYEGYAKDLWMVERSMRMRRAQLLAVLKEDEIAPSVVCFPLLGVGDFTHPPAKPGGPIAESLFIPDECINPHPRFGALTRNIRSRRGSRVQVRVPKFRDVATKLSTAHTADEDMRMHAARETTLRYHAADRAIDDVQTADDDDDIYMDAMAFGMGCCCLQVTFQARDVGESRHLYDQLAVMAPIMLALSAATPVFRGFLSDVDVRWNVIASSVDDRKPAEADPTDTTSKNVRNARYGSISCYICAHNGGHETMRFNDIKVEVDDESYKTLIDAGMDMVLSQHVANLFVRDPLVIMKERIKIDDMENIDHWENLQSTNWLTVRWKPPPFSAASASVPGSPIRGATPQQVAPAGPSALSALHASMGPGRQPELPFCPPALDPPGTTGTTAAAGIRRGLLSRAPPPPPVSDPSKVVPDLEAAVGAAKLGSDQGSSEGSEHSDPPANPGAPNHIGWRTEFRSMEIQLTDYENAAFTVFIVIASRAILLFELNLYIPISALDDNMATAHQMNAAVDGQFHWRQHLAPFQENDCKASGGTSCCSIHAEQESTELMSAYQILMGKGSYYPGLIPLMNAYMEYIEMDEKTKQMCSKYFDLIVSRAAGTLLTPAQWMRSFIRKHPDYKQDSVVSQSIAHDLMMACKDIGEGKLHVPEMHGNTVKFDPIDKAEAYSRYLNKPLDRTETSRIMSIVDRFKQRAANQQRRRELEGKIKAKEESFNKLKQELEGLKAELASMHDDL